MSAAPAAAMAGAPRRLPEATRATYAAFFGTGAATASWASRLPQIRDGLALTPARLGLVLLSVAGGSLLALPLSGVLVQRYRPRRTITVMSVLLASGMVVLGTGYLVGVVPVLVGFAMIGFGNAAWDVAMNVHGAAVERELGRAIMPRFHAGYSVGTVVGALLGAVMVAAGVPVTAHLLAVAVLVGAVVPLSVRNFLPADEPPRAGPTTDPPTTDPPTIDPPATDSHGPGHLARWREPRTLLIGVFVLTFAFAEGTGNDWVSIALIDGHRTEAAVGTLGFACFLTAMTAGRWFGPKLLDRYGRVRVVRLLAALAVVGVAVFVVSPVAWLAFIGALLWGLGVSLGFPVGMSAASDEPGAAAARVSVVASIGYCAFLGGPPLIGFLGDRFSVLHAVSAVAVLMALAVLVAGSLDA